MTFGLFVATVTRLISFGETARISSRSQSILMAMTTGGIFCFEDVDGGGEVREIGHGVLDRSGHLSYLPGNEWILNDTYPNGAARMQTPHLYEVSTGRRVDLGDFHLPPIYKGEWRVDTHPRLSPDGNHVCIDAPHEGEGRQLHLIDIRQVTG